MQGKEERGRRGWFCPLPETAVVAKGIVAPLPCGEVGPTRRGQSTRNERWGPPPSYRRNIFFYRMVNLVLIQTIN